MGNQISSSYRFKVKLKKLRNTRCVQTVVQQKWENAVNTKATKYTYTRNGHEKEKSGVLLKFHNLVICEKTNVFLNKITIPTKYTCSSTK